MAEKLTVKQKLGFGIFDLGGNMLFTLMTFWSLKYLTDTVGLAAAWAGAAVMVGKIWDGVNDPLMGYITDRTLSRWGRRRIYLLFGAIPMMLTLVFFFTAPSYLPASLHFVWAIVALVILDAASTIINIPYTSLTPELSDDYNEQSSLNGYRFGCAVFGTIAGAAAVQPLVKAFAKPGSPNPLLDPRGFSMMSIILGAVMALVTLITFFGTKERKITKEELPKESFIKTYREVIKNKPFVIIFLTYALHMVAITFITTSLPYYTENVLKRPDITTNALAILLVTAMVFIPVSVQVSKKIGKKRTYQICFAIIASACIVLFFLGHRLSLNFFYGLLVYAGIGVGFSYVSPFAMIPDAIEYWAAKTGQRTEGAYYGLYTLFSKLGTALALFITGLILSAGGYISTSGGGTVQPASVSGAIRIIIGPLPMVVLIAGIVVLNFYPLDKKEYREAAAKKAQ
ncbi:MAG: MFS transporter [Treponema sp.]|nr:MFS transporter [Treponema sp.]